ncbi:LCP family protein [Adlercreutzia sp. ZJ141]|uniref:LCP family protein n=1 Tax=Adlercreutzia sp. ZJ141 TaxID=2709406 RepID=UPI001F14BE08|nr:LCP family protein [Adlercreutzia sp. ZJ141]
MAYERRNHTGASRPSVRPSARPSRSSSHGGAPSQSESRYGRSRYGSSSQRTSTRSASAYGSSSTSGQSYEDFADRSRYTRGSNARVASNAADEFSSTPRMSRYHYVAKRKNSRRKAALIAVIAALVVVLGGAGAALAYYANISGNLHEGLTSGLLSSLTDTYADTDPFYMLLMGTDGSAEREAASEFEGDQFRTDSIMLVRVDPSNKKVTMISILRDTYVDMGEYGQNKINTAHALGGAELAVKTVSDLAGVDINHYAEINFDGFKSIVDALGGIEVDVPMAIDDPEAGGSLEAGPQTLNGDQALILCRSRHAYDEYGKGDEYRAANQRLVLSAIAEKLLQSDARTIASTVSALSEYVTTDFEVNEIIGLAQAMRGLNPETDIYTGTEPTESVYINDQWFEIVDVDAWTAMMERVDQGLPPNEEDYVDEATGTVFSTGNGTATSSTDSGSTTVTVLNGNGVSGASSSAAATIDKAGFETTTTDNADSFNYTSTIIMYANEQDKEAAQKIADALGVGTVQASDGSIPFETAFLVVLGADYS